MPYKAQFSQKKTATEPSYQQVTCNKKAIAPDEKSSEAMACIFLEFAVSWCSWIRNYVADVLDAC